jgi:hypothetical protein
MNRRQIATYNLAIGGLFAIGGLVFGVVAFFAGRTRSGGSSRRVTAQALVCSGWCCCSAPSRSYSGWSGSSAAWPTRSTTTSG